MNWYQWDTEADFIAWHTALNTQLGYPNEATGTIQYTEARLVENKWIALVDDEYAEGLVLSDLRPKSKTSD
jgi:hypothetical protein